MANVLVESDSLKSIADAIRSKNGTQNKYKPAQMAEAISDIGGIIPVGTKQISITANGTTTEDVTDYANAQISVNVPNPSTGTKNITANGTYDVTNFASAEVNIANPSTGTKTIIANGTYDVTDFASALVNIPLATELIGTYEVELEEYTNTSTSETITTTINIKSSPYEFHIIVITCDSEITTSTEWGMTVALASKFQSNGQLYINASLQGQAKGASSFSHSGMVNNVSYGVPYGCVLNNNTQYVIFTRKASSQMPKIRGGKYTVKAYGLTGL